MDDLFQCFIPNDFKLTEMDSLSLKKLLVPIPKNESKRIEALREADLLDTSAEEDYDRFTRMCCRVFNVLHSLLLMYFVTC